MAETSRSGDLPYLFQPQKLNLILFILLYVFNNIINLIRLVMKKYLLLFGIMLGFVLPSTGQVSHDWNVNDREPVINETIAKEKIPAAILSAFEKKFDINSPATWSKFPYALKEYGWVYDVGASDVKLDRYIVKTKIGKDREFWAVYSSTGDLIESRETSTDAAIPPTVREAFINSQYKDWQIVGTKEIIKFYHDHDESSVEQHFRLTVQKDDVKRSISFNFQGSSN